MLNQSLRPLEYRLLAVDLDGTVVGRDLVIPDGTLAAIDAFRERGGIVTVATGRTLVESMPFVRQLHIDGPVICYQGALVRDPGTGETIFHQPLPAELAVEAVVQLLSDGIYVQAHIDDELVVPYNREETTYYRSFSPFDLPVTVVDDLPSVIYAHPPTKLLFIADEHTVGQRVAGMQVHFADRLQVARSHERFGELTAPGCTKGRALALLAERLQIPQAAVAAAGDQGNDIDMVTWAGLGMAVRSGPADLVACADVLIDEPKDAGLAAGIRRYLLGDLV